MFTVEEDDELSSLRFASESEHIEEIDIVDEQFKFY
jgi:hypothetical protein